MPCLPQVDKFADIMLLQWIKNTFARTIRLHLVMKINLFWKLAYWSITIFSKSELTTLYDSFKKCTLAVSCLANRILLRDKDALTQSDIRIINNYQ